MPEFLNPIARQRRPVVVGVMIEADRGIQTGALDQSFQFARNNRIAEIQQRIDRVARAPLKNSLRYDAVHLYILNTWSIHEA